MKDKLRESFALEDKLAQVTKELEIGLE